MGLLQRLKSNWAAQNAQSPEQQAAQKGQPTQSQRNFAQKLKEEITLREEKNKEMTVLAGQDSEQKG